MFEWLFDYQKISEEIEYLVFQLDREKRELERWTCGDLIKVRLTEGSIASGLEERIEAMELDLAHKMNDLYNAENIISSFKGLENQILYYRYVKGMTLVQVAAELTYSYNYIKSKHAEIMRMIKFADRLSV